MNWIIASLMMFFSSVCLYLCVRKAALEKFPTQYNNLAMFLIPLIVFVLSAVVTGQNFAVGWWNFFLIIGIAVVFSYLGNVASLVSIEKAPNPGYSLVISKSYVVFTTLVSVIFFQSELSLRKALAILVIVLCSAVIMLSQKAGKLLSTRKWLSLAIVAFFCWGMLSLSSKYLFTQHVTVLVFLTYLYLVVTICIVIEMWKKKVDVRGIAQNPWIFGLIGISSAGFNLFQFMAIQLAPNVGYVNAINASSISAVTVLAILLFKDEYSVKKTIGVVGVTVGLLLLLV